MSTGLRISRATLARWALVATLRRGNRLHVWNADDSNTPTAGPSKDY